MDNSIRLRAFAKINLGLKILGKRPDGYHEIRTIYQTVSLHDRLEIALAGRGRGVQLQCSDPTLPSGADNLVSQACELWKRARQFRGGIEVRLEKRIPAGAGLGGASTDAATAILGLERLTGDRLPARQRFEVAARLGSDVPFFLWGGRALGVSRGDEVYPLADLPKRQCLVVFPGFSMSTSEAYRAAGARLTGQRKRPNIVRFGVWSPLPLVSWGPAENDFERVVFARWPELARLKSQLLRAGAESAALTGSGSAVYALFDSAPHLNRALQFVPAGWQTFRTRTLTRTEYQRLLFREQ